MTVTIDADLAIRTLREVVAEKGPDYTYEDELGRMGAAAHYVNFYTDGKPACIAGHVYQKWFDAGILTPEQWEKMDRRDGVEAVFEGLELNGVGAHDAIGVLGTAQERQDLGDSWGVALLRAEETYRDLPLP